MKSGAGAPSLTMREESVSVGARRPPRLEMRPAFTSLAETPPRAGTSPPSEVGYLLIRESTPLTTTNTSIRPLPRDVVNRMSNVLPGARAFLHVAR